MSALSIHTALRRRRGHDRLRHCGDGHHRLLTLVVIGALLVVTSATLLGTSALLLGSY